MKAQTYLAGLVLIITAVQALPITHEAYGFGRNLPAMKLEPEAQFAGSDRHLSVMDKEPEASWGIGRHLTVVNLEEDIAKVKDDQEANFANHIYRPVMNLDQEA
ncbi:hypothetical protein BX616_000156 [Lobosporangium transversale]|uniref:Uncharacterized protein n=1 Tax=Lobosporangium transversale TaxID=64571 RepID=A0A1Y2GHZ3_9FUNG|nr:hypothetical protein BCR41DRAFT_357081 [Lobosporangium transversale]KAF9908430.1 hypothetical protein BX616_000156 [Lobosporangium transversale]ORZ11357.1 hypothetical protein BCR41DRAFT_357081 [Lobosporangium transversale]|eukprot:XP_021879672.1 hypothetical protein BCR41DRAFT_357081 [Lobosporangium transversale]